MNDLQINGSRISEVNETKFLGVIIDNKLSWSSHIMYISKKIAKGIGINLKARKVFNNETLFSLYYTFVYPYLNYCIHVWGKTYDTHLHHLIVLQNMYVCVAWYLVCETSLLLQCGIIYVQIFKSIASWCVWYFFSKLADVHEYNTRNASTQHAYVCFQRTTRGQKNFKLQWCPYLELCSW